MKRVVLFAVCAIAATGAAAQWHYLSGGKLSGISSVGSYVWAVGQDGLMFYSEDNGQSWRRVPRFTTRNLVDVEFWDRSLGLVTAEGGTVFRTTDNGASWDSVQVPHGGHRARWLSASRVYIAAAESSFVVRSDDAGQTWDLWGSPYCPWFLDTLHGWGASTSDSVMRTRDGGVNWTHVGELPYVFDFARAFGFSDTSVGICGYVEDVTLRADSLKLGWRSYLWEATADGGWTWSNISKDGQPIRVCDIDPSGRILALEEKRCGQYQYGTLNWVDFSRTQSLTDLSAARGDYAWVCGSGAALWFSSDGGLTWQSSRPSTGALLTDVEFSDDMHGWGAGDGGLVIRSTDAGRSWTDVSVPVKLG